MHHTPSRARGDFWNRWRESRDLIFWDQRGTGYSEPKFCEEMDRVFDTTRYLGLPPGEATARRVEAARDCREEMLAKGVDFSAYNSEASARDLDDLRRALGHERWNLFGLSYGTRLALTALRETPSGIRSVILDSTSPPDVRIWVESPGALARSLGRVFERCAADEACRRAHPDLEADFHAWLDRLDRDPVELVMEDTTRFPDGRLVVDRSLAVGAVFRGLYDRRFPPLLPLLVREGGPEGAHVWRALADFMARTPGTNSRGLNLSVNCYEVAPFNPPALLDSARSEHPRLGDILEHRSRHAECEAWHDERADSIFFRPVRSDVPTLILGGEFDPTTPPDYGRRAAETLANSTFLEVPGLGHGVAPNSECAQDVMGAFLDDPALPPDTSCVSDVPSLSFVTDVHTSRGVYPLARILQQGPGRPFLAGAGVLALVLLSGALGWPLGALVRRLRGRPSPRASGLERGARWLAALAALLAMGFAAGLVFALRDAASANPLLLAFGVPGDFGWVFHLPWVVAALTAAVLVAAVRSWREGWWSGWHRLHYSLVGGACVAVLALVVHRGLM